MNPWGADVPPSTEAEFFNAARVTAFLLVEGGTDERFWLSRVDPRACQVRAMGSRESALAEIREAGAEGRKGLVAVLDADFDRLDATLPDDRDVVWTDMHDLDTMLLASPAFDKVLVEVGSRKKIRELEVSEGRDLRASLTARGAAMGRLRWLSKREGLRLTFRKKRPDGTLSAVDHAKFCDRATWRVDVAKMVRAVLDFSGDPKTKVEDLMSRMRALPDADEWQVCNGHDLVGLLVIGLRSKVGNRSLGVDDVEERLRLAFERDDLQRTAMYGALRRWEQRCAPYRLFVLPGVTAR